MMRCIRVILDTRVQNKELYTSVGVQEGGV